VLISVVAALLLAAPPAAALPLPPAPVPVAVANPGFEDGLDGWTASGAATVGVTRATPLAGVRSLSIASSPGGAQTTVLSAPVTLEVGKLYRLSASVRTRGVAADPLARYPTALGACLSMRSTPFTNCSPSLAGDRQERLELLFFAVAAQDQVALHLGRNGAATGTALFDEVRLERLDDVTAYIPLEQVRWSGPGFRYDDGGWIVVHVEGEPYARGRQYGELVAPELARYLEKLAVLQDKGDPEKGWAALRLMADALMLRRFDPEYLEEMKGIADGAVKGGARFKGRELDLLDIVTLNSAVDLGQLDAATRVTPTALSGRSFLKAEDETDPAVTATDRCSSFVATGSATPGGRFVMGQLFMWNGYTGVHWDVILDVVPARGHRVVLQTFPGGIHSGSDWYLNDAGIVIGETTVGQTPFQPDGTPQANRARKAAQYAGSIDEVARILREKNNGLYTNDWTIADAKTDEGADLLLGTRASRLWRTGHGDTPGRLKDFIWANNNTRDPAVRAEYAVTADGAPADMAFSAWNRDIAFWNFYQARGKGGIDLEAAIRLHASSPINRPHACDGKITTGEMADKLVFIAHYGKTTQREKWVGSRFIPDLPGAVPHLTLGYTTFSPVTVADGLKAARARAGQPPVTPAEPTLDATAVKAGLEFDKKLLWKGTFFPAADADNWLTSGSAAYHAILKKLPEDRQKALDALRDALGELDLRHNWLATRETLTTPLATRSAYDRYGPYAIPRVRGTFALHQLRLALGNASFSRVMTTALSRFAGVPISTAQFVALASEVGGRDVAPLLDPWLRRSDLPDPRLAVAVTRAGERWETTLTITHAGAPWRYLAAVALDGPKTRTLERVEITGAEQRFTFTTAERPIRVSYDVGGDVPVLRDDVYALTTMLDQFDALLWVQGTSRQVEANRSLALVWREAVADAFVEVLPAMRPDAGLGDAELAAADLVVVGGPADNDVAARMAARWKLPLEVGPGWFRWQGRLETRPGAGLAVAFPNPWNGARAAYLFLANSKVELWRMVKGYQRGQQSFSLWREDEIVRKGWLGAERLEVEVAPAPPATAATATAATAATAAGGARP
jgi:hypothetical protein